MNGSTMVRFIKQLLSSERGQALPIVLAMLAIGGLTIAGSLNYASASLNGSRIIGEDVKGTYAAGAGVEYALWSLLKSVSPPAQVPENIGQMTVSLQTDDNGIYTLYLGELIQPGMHFDFLDVMTEIVWEEGAEAYKYTITVTLLHHSTIHLIEVGAKMPAGYNYQSGSASSFVDNLATGEPEEILDMGGAYLLNWELEPPYPSVSPESPVQTQTFYVTGEGSHEGHYAWVVANRDDVGAVGEIRGASYKITATALRSGDNRRTAEITADVMIEGGTVHIVSWQISS